MADERVLRAWEALDLGPLWIRRTAPATGDADGVEDDFAAGAELEVSAVAVSEDAWATLQAEVAACRRCGLCESRRNTVFGTGPATARWMLIGEAPGAEEDARGEPFVGAAGQLLTQMLAAAGLARETDVFITNILKCRPPGNRNPEPEEVAKCTPYLLRQIERVKPRLILAMGRFAAQTLLDTDASIASLRGKVHRYAGVPLIVTYHPAYLLRTLPDKAKAWADLVFARKTMAALK
jgi:uracil-DNA glycosylase family 4